MVTSLLRRGYNMIIDGKSYFVLNTDSTTYLLRITDSGHLEHLYYGKRIRVTDGLYGLIERQEFPPGNNNVYSPDHPQMTLNNMLLEVSFDGKGDNREAFLEIEHADGSITSDFLFRGAKVEKGVKPLDAMPSSYDESGDAECLEIEIYDSFYDQKLILDYYEIGRAHV